MYLDTDKEHDTASENTILVITQDLRDNKYLKCCQIRGIILAKFEGWLKRNKKNKADAENSWSQT
jgi:hypothetical protein